MIIFDKYYKIEAKGFIEQLAKTFNFRGLDYNKVKDNVFLCCPFHSGGQERTASANFLLVDKEGKQAGDFWCYGCHTGGHISSILVKLFGDKKLAEEWVNSHYGDQAKMVEEVRIFTPIQLELEVEPKEEEQFFELPEYAYYSETTYFSKRGIPDELVKRYKLGFIDSPDESKRKVYFPVFDKQGRVIFYQTRNIHSKAFYLPVGYKKYIWNANNIEPGQVVVCESIFNALTAIKNGFQAVAIFGCGDKRIYEQLLDLPCRGFLICTDNDMAGNKGASEIAAVLKTNGRIVKRILVDEPGKDLNDYANLTHTEFIEKWNSWVRSI